MAASSSSQLSLLLAHDRSSGYTSSSGPAPTSINLKSQAGLVNRASRRHSGAIAVTQGSGYKKRLQHIVGARRPGKDRDGALAEAVEEVKIPENSEPDDMFMGRKLEGLEPDFWEGEKWDALGFIVQYLWAFGILVSVCFLVVAERTLSSPRSVSLFLCLSVSLSCEANGVSKPLRFIGLKSVVMGALL